MKDNVRKCGMLKEKIQSLFKAYFLTHLMSGTFAVISTSLIRNSMRFSMNPTFLLMCDMFS